MKSSTHRNTRIAALGFRSIPMTEGSAGADKFASELFPRLVKKGYQVTAYNRVYPNQSEIFTEYKGVRIVNIRTILKSGFDTLYHSLKSTIHILFFNTGDIIHIQNGGNSIWALIFRIFGKYVVVSQDGVDWKRDKWPWYGKLYLNFSIYLTAHLPNRVIFDNVFVKKIVEEMYAKKFNFVPFGSEVEEFNATDALNKYGLRKNEYYLFIGRFIPDKGLHYLIPAFNSANTQKKLVLVGGSPNPTSYEGTIKSSISQSILMPGYIYGDDVNTLIGNCYCYIQPSDVEGLSPVILQVMGFGRPIICSDISENMYVVKDTGIPFKKSDIHDLSEKIQFAEDNPEQIGALGELSQSRAQQYFSWDAVTDDHIEIFKNL
jgi:glycosyltransferase involved in cell wall biosynthesis